MLKSCLTSKSDSSFTFARHGHNLTGVSPERAPIAGSVSLSVSEASSLKPVDLR